MGYSQHGAILVVVQWHVVEVCRLVLYCILMVSVSLQAVTDLLLAPYKGEA